MAVDTQTLLVWMALLIIIEFILLIAMFSAACWLIARNSVTTQENQVLRADRERLESQLRSRQEEINA